MIPPQDPQIEECENQIRDLKRKYADFIVPSMEQMWTLKTEYKAANSGKSWKTSKLASVVPASEKQNQEPQQQHQKNQEPQQQHQKKQEPQQQHKKKENLKDRAVGPKKAIGNPGEEPKKEQAKEDGPKKQTKLGIQAKKDVDLQKWFSEVIDKFR